MAFTVDDFQDLLRLLDSRPDWRDELRQRLLTSELLQLPLLVAGVEQRLASLTEAQTRTERQLEVLTSRVDALTEAQIRTERQLQVQTARIDKLADRVGELNDRMLEWHHERHVPTFFGRLARHARLVEPSQLADLLDDAVDNGRLPEAERDDVLLADLVVCGRRRTDQADVLFLGEVSVGVGVEDVRRAVDRAASLGKLGTPVVPVVIGEHIIPEAAAYARARGAWQLLAGRAVAPGQP